MSRNEFDIVIIGAGLAGLATAYYLGKARAGRVCVLEKEKAAGQGASGQNASMVCRAAEDPVMAKMAEMGASGLAELARELGGIGFRACGSLFVGKARHLQSLHPAGPIQGRRETLERFPFLEDSDFEAALYFPSDGVADVPSVLAALERAVKAQGTEIIYGSPCRPAGGRLPARRVINAAGAWAGGFAREAGAQTIPISPMRRHIFVTRELDWVDPGWPIVWDVAHNVYFRPEGRGLLMSPCDEEPHPPGPARVDPRAESSLRAKLGAAFPRAAGAQMAGSWAGLRTFTPDHRFVIGPDSQREGFFWAACLGGHGVTTFAAVGKFVAETVMGGTPDAELVAAFSPARFKN